MLSPAFALPSPGFGTSVRLQGLAVRTQKNKPRSHLAKACGAIYFEMEMAGERAGANISFWERTAQKFSTRQLQQDTTADVCVIGAGIAGVTTAYLAARDNRSIVLVDDGPVGGGMTGRTTAHLV